MFLSFYWVSTIHWELEKLYSFFRGANQWKVPGWKKLSRHDSPIFPKKRPNVICKMATHLRKPAMGSIDPEFPASFQMSPEQLMPTRCRRCGRLMKEAVEDV